MRKIQHIWSLLLLSLLAFALQGCLGFGGPATKNISTNNNGSTVSVVQNTFKGKIYATIGHNLFYFTGDGQSHQLVGGGNVSDPAVSPDGTKIAFIQRYKQYSDLAYVDASGGQPRVLISGNGRYRQNSLGFWYTTYHWFFEPTWSADGSSLLFLSDLNKAANNCTNEDAPMLDLQVFTIPFNNPSAKPAVVAYAAFGGGGDRDPSYRPDHPDQIMYAHYSPLPGDESNQVVQIFLADPGELARHPTRYCAGTRDSGVAISDPKDEVIQPAFSPDGSVIAYIKRDNPTSMSLALMPVPENVTKNPNDPNVMKLALLPYQQSSHILTGLDIARPVWSPDGKQIAYITENNNTLDLWLINLKHNLSTGTYTLQGSPTQVTSGGIDGDSRVVWTS